MSRLPLIGVTACSRQIGLHAYHISGDKYVRAVAVAAKGLPLILPALAELLDPTDILDGLDGILFTGSSSNVEPFHYSGPASTPGAAHDPARDSTTLPLIRSAVAAGVPVLGISSNPHYLAIFQAFGDACRMRAIQRDADASTSA